MVIKTPDQTENIKLGLNYVTDKNNSSLSFKTLDNKKTYTFSSDQDTFTQMFILPSNINNEKQDNEINWALKPYEVKKKN